MGGLNKPTVATKMFFDSKTQSCEQKLIDYIKNNDITITDTKNAIVITYEKVTS